MCGNTDWAGQPATRYNGKIELGVLQAAKAPGSPGLCSLPVVTMLSGSGEWLD